MSRQQREQIDAMLRGPRPAETPTVQQIRAGFRALMAKMIVPDGIRTEGVSLGDRPAVLVEPGGTAKDDGTILYIHGGGFVFGSPETAMPIGGSSSGRSHRRASATSK